MSSLSRFLRKSAEINEPELIIQHRPRYWWMQQSEKSQSVAIEEIPAVRIQPIIALNPGRLQPLSSA